MSVYIVKRRLGTLLFFSGMLVLVSGFAFWNFHTSSAGAEHEQHWASAKVGLGASVLFFAVSLLLRLVGSEWLLRVHERWWHGRTRTAMDGACEPVQSKPLVSLKDNPSVLALLIVVALGASVFFVHRANKPDTFRLVRQGAAAQLGELLSENPGALAGKDKRGKTLLMVAVEGGCQETVGLLLRYGVDPNAADRVGNPALAYAIQDVWLAQLLLENGADVNQPCKAGDSPITLAIRHKSLA